MNGEMFIKKNTELMAKIKNLLCITKDRLKNKPQHYPLHLKIEKEILDLQIDIDFNGIPHESTCKSYF